MVDHYIYVDEIKIRVSQECFKNIISSLKDLDYQIRQFDDGYVTEYWVFEPGSKYYNFNSIPFPPKFCGLLGYTCSNTI